MSGELVRTYIPEQRLLEDGSGVFPLVLAPRDGAVVGKTGLTQWCQRHEVELRSMALHHGAVLLRGCTVQSADDFSAVTRVLNCEAYPYLGGAAPREEIIAGEVYTLNDSPLDQPIPFHHVLSQAPRPPSFAFLYCEQAEGGSTPIIHSGEVAAFLERTAPDFARKLEVQGVRYIRVIPEVTDKSSAQGRSWRDTFCVSTREEAEEVMRKQSISWEWLANGDCRTVTAVLPALRVDRRTGKKVFFNSIVAALMGWNDARNVGEKSVVLGDGSVPDIDTIRAVARFMEDRRVTFKWQQGDVLFIDNMLVMTGRDSSMSPGRVLISLRGPPRTPGTEDLGIPPLRVGIIGVGAMGKEHIRNFKLLGPEVATVVAVADSDERARKEAVEELGPRADPYEVFSTWEELVDCKNVDSVVICTPNFQHIEIIPRAIAAGKHILCEKPLCTTVADCEEVERLVEEREQSARLRGERAPIFMTGMEYRWMPPISRLIEETDSGVHGKVHTVSIREHRFPFLVKVNNWNRWNRYTGGTLVEKACHFFDLMRRIARSEPVSVYASGDQAVNHKDEIYEEGPSDIIDHALCIVQFANGTRAALDLCMFAEDEQTEQVTAVCELGKVEARSPDSIVRIVNRKHRSTPGRAPPDPTERAVPHLQSMPVPEDLASAGYHEGATFFELRAFCEAAKGLRPVPVTARDGKMAVAMGAAAHESILKKQVVNISDIASVGRHWAGVASSVGSQELPSSRL